MNAAQTCAVIDLNLLPAEHRPAQVSGVAVAIAGLLAIMLIAAVPLAFRANAARERASDAQELARGSELELDAVEAELLQVRALRVEIEQLNTTRTALEEERAFLQGGTRPLHEDLAWLHGLGFLPPGARISAITSTETGFSVEGVAGSPLDGIAYAEKLSTTGGFAGARMTSFTPGTNEPGRFTVEVLR